MSWSSIWSTVSWAQHCLLDWPASRWPRTRLACYRAAVLERHLVDGELGPALSPRDLSDAALRPDPATDLRRRHAPKRLKLKVYPTVSWVRHIYF